MLSPLPCHLKCVHRPGTCPAGSRTQITRFWAGKAVSQKEGSCAVQLALRGRGNAGPFYLLALVQPSWCLGSPGEEGETQNNHKNWYCLLHYQKARHTEDVVTTLPPTDATCSPPNASKISMEPLQTSGESHSQATTLKST